MYPVHRQVSDQAELGFIMIYPLLAHSVHSASACKL